MSPALETLDVSLTVTRRDDGGIRVTSADVPGLLLSGSDPHRVWAVVGPGIERLLQTNRGLDVVRVSGPMIPPTTDGELLVHVEHRGVADRAA